MPIENPTYTPVTQPHQGFKSFAAFYPFYLGEHSLPTTRRLHLAGTTIALLASARAVASLIPRVILLVRDMLLSSPLEAGTLHRIIEQALRRTMAWRLDGSLRIVMGGIISAYAFAWTAHFFVEKNKPATFTYPVWSLRGDLKLWWEVVTLQRGF
jgi:hypothetical protein